MFRTQKDSFFVKQCTLHKSLKECDDDILYEFRDSHNGLRRLHSKLSGEKSPLDTKNNKLLQNSTSWPATRLQTMSKALRSAQNYRLNELNLLPEALGLEGLDPSAISKKRRDIELELEVALRPLSTNQAEATATPTATSANGTKKLAPQSRKSSKKRSKKASNLASIGEQFRGSEGLISTSSPKNAASAKQSVSTSTSKLSLEPSTTMSQKELEGARDKNKRASVDAGVAWHEMLYESHMGGSQSGVYKLARSRTEGDLKDLTALLLERQKKYKHFLEFDIVEAKRTVGQGQVPPSVNDMELPPLSDGISLKQPHNSPQRG